MCRCSRISASCSPPASICRRRWSRGSSTSRCCSGSAMAMTVAHHAPWPRSIVDAAEWQSAIDELAAERSTLLGLWGEPDVAHMAVLAGNDISVLSIACTDRKYPSVGLHHNPAIRLERAMRDLFGLDPVGLPDTRPWLDHGRWGIATPLALSPGKSSGETL